MKSKSELIKEQVKKRLKMDFKERLDATNSILKKCPYETNKQKIKELFTKTQNRIFQNLNKSKKQLPGCLNSAGCIKNRFIFI